MGEREWKGPCAGAHHRSTGGVGCHSGTEQLRSFSPRHGNCHQRRPSKEPMEASMGEKNLLNILSRIRNNKADCIITQERAIFMPFSSSSHTSLTQREEEGGRGQGEERRE